MELLGSHHRNGWTATVGIPFATLNFMRSHDVIWGINFKRFIRRKNEEDLWSGWRRVYGAARISQAGELRGISDIGSGRLFIVKPYGADRIKSSATGSRRNRTYTGNQRAAHRRSGCEAWSAIEPGSQLHGQHRFRRRRCGHTAIQSHALQAVLPEKRQFFLENAGVFNFPLGGEVGICFSSAVRLGSIQ